MTAYSRCSRARLGALMIGCAVLPLLSACSLYNRVFHHGRMDAGCTEKPFALNTDVRPPLKVPEGLSSPDTRNSVKVPELPAPEHTRAKSEPCLSRPPPYFATPPKPVPTTIPGAPLTEMPVAPATPPAATPPAATPPPPTPESK